MSNRDAAPRTPAPPLLAGVEQYVRWFDGVNRRAIRDVGVLPDSALLWRPEPRLDTEQWTVAELVGHIAASRRFFSGAILGRGWFMEPWPEPLPDIASCVRALRESFEELATTLSERGDELLTARVEALDEPGQTVAGWRLLMMLAEHDVHHRAQIVAYAGLNGWPVEQIFGRTYEDVLRSGRERRASGL